MRVALLADIHSSRHALDAVVRDAESRGVRRFWFLGDAVGYGPHPTAALMFVRDRVQKNAWVLGNHDAALCGRADVGSWREHALEALELNRKAVADHPEVEAWCRRSFTHRRCQPVVRDYRDGRYVLVHASLDDELNDYLYQWHTAFKIPREFNRLRDEYGDSRGRPVCLCHGHTHIPALLTKDSVSSDIAFVDHFIVPGEPMPLGRALSIVNPGSVGQPRDGDRRASYAILDTRRHTVEFQRISYDVKAAVRDLVHPVWYPDRVQKILVKALTPSDAPAGWFEASRDRRDRGGVEASGRQGSVHR